MYDNDYTPANLNEGTAGGNFDPLYDPDDDDYLGLGGEDINWKDSPSISSQQKDNNALYDGYGDYTTPYSTASLYMNRRHISMHCFFYTQRDEYDAYWVVGRNDNPKTTTEGNQHQFSQELAGFHTSNQNKGIPTMQIYLFGYRDWEQILKPNDYVALRVWETYPDMPSVMNKGIDQKLYPRDTRGIRHRTLMVGLISQIQTSTDSTSSARVYVITCQGMQKVLANINLGLPKTAQWNDVNLLYDINGESSPWNEQFPTYSKGSGNSSSGSSSGGTSKEIGSATEQGIIAWCNHMGYSVNQTAGVLAAAEGESSMGTAHNGYNLLGYSPGSNTVGTSLLGNVTPSKSNAYKFCQEFYEKTDGGIKQYKSATASYSAFKCGAWFCAHVDVPGGQSSMNSSPAQQRGTWAEKFAKELK